MIINSIFLSFQQIISFNSNPYSYSESSANIGSKGVLALEFKTEAGEPVLVKNLAEDINIILVADERRVVSEETVKMSFQIMSDVKYQKVCMLSLIGVNTVD